MQTSSIGGDASDSVLKHELRLDRTIARRLGIHRRVGEFVFVPNAPQASERDGVLMGFVYDASTDRSGFHGNWAPTAL